MISLIFFLAGTIITFTCGLTALTNLSSLHTCLICLSAIIGEVIINGVIAIVVCKWLPDKYFSSKLKFYHPSKKECKFYQLIGIKNWKDKTAELGFLNGFRKNKLLQPNNPEYYQKFILESNKGFITHLLGMIIGAVSIFILPPIYQIPIGLPIIITNFLINFLALAILRYNIPRLEAAFKFSQRKKTIN